MSILTAGALLLLLGPAVLKAQVLTGTLTGSVVDPSDAVVPNANAVITDVATGKEYRAVTDSRGEFTVTSLSNGMYKVQVDAVGFSKVVIEQVQVFVSQTSHVTAKLEVGRLGVEIVVAAAQSVIQTESAELKTSIDRQQILNLPLPTRNPLDLVRTMAGITSPTSSTIGDSFVHGLRGNATNLTFDGINVADNFVKTSAFFGINTPTVDTVGEFNVSVGGIGADAGFGAAQVTMVTQRGSNSFHGAAYWYQRTNALNANTWFNNQAGIARPFQLQNRLGAQAGAPVIIPKLYNGKNRTFVFGNYEAFREPLSRPRTRTVLTPSARNGLFTWTPPGGSPQTINLLSIGAIGSTGVAPQINKNVMDFYNNFVPTDGLTDAACTNGDGVNVRCFAFNLPGKNITDRYTIRVDHNLTEKHHIEFVWNQQDFDSTPDLLNSIEPNFPKSPTGGQGSRRQLFTWALHSTIGTNKTNEARFGYQRAPVGFNYPETFSGTGGYQLALLGNLTDPILTSTNLPQGRNTPVRQLIDNFAWQKGRHSLRFGGEYRQILANSYFYNIVIPRVILGVNSANPDGLTAAKFPGGIAAGDLTRASTVFDVVTGLLNNINQGFNHTSASSGFVKGVPRTVDPIQHNISGYVQDSFRLKPGLTVQFGTRWEYQGVFDLRNALMLMPVGGTAGFWGPTAVGNLFNPTNTPVAQDTLLALGGGHNGRPLYKRDWNNFAPFFGFAYDPFKNGKTSIRGGFASHYTQDGFTLFQTAATANLGLFTTVANNTPTGVFSNSSNPLPAPPVDQFPVSQRNNFINNTGAALWNFDPNLATPYILEWNFGVQRELWKRFALEVRYVGNHAVKQFRSYSINELNVSNNGVLQEFLNAQNNLRIGGTSFANQGLPGQVALPIFDKLFNGLAAASGFANSTFLTNLNQNVLGAMFNTLRTSNTYRANREANFPLNNFVANPFANQAIQVDNSSWGYFHGLEVEVNRRFSSLVFTANYTYSKVLSDVRFLTNQTENQNFLSLTNRRLDKNRAAQDVTHSFSSSYVYPLPFGRGKRFLGNIPSYANYIVGGWQVNGLTKWASGSPFSIMSNRQTTGSIENTTAVVRNMTAKDLQKFIGVYRQPSGVFWLNPASGLIAVSGNTSRAVFCTAGQTTPCFDHPGVNQFGNTPFFGFNLPRFFDQDFSIAKHTRFGPEGRLDFETRFEFFNAFNNPNFNTPTNQIDSSAFGKLTGVVDVVRGGGATSRLIQWVARVNF